MEMLADNTKYCSN